MSRSISPDDIFRLNPKIRWAALSTGDGRIAFSQIRPGFVSYGRDEDDRAFMEFGPQLMIGIAGRLSYRGAAGKIQSMIVNLEKYSALITQLRDGYLAISADRVDAIQVFEDVEPLIRRL